MDDFAHSRPVQKGRRVPLSIVLSAALWPAVAGCNGSSGSLPVLTVYEVKGKVLLPGGQPLSSGSVYFVPKGDLTVTPNGTIGSDGTFSLVTGGSGEGAPAGEYKVRVETSGAGIPSAKKSQRPPFPFKYTDEDSSGLVVTVRPEANRLNPIILK